MKYKNSIYKEPYEITQMTMAVVAKQGENGYMESLIMEEDDEFVVAHAPIKIIDFACKFFGASLQGRQSGTKALTGITHKAPISIDPSSGMYYFPTCSPVNPTCSWIGHTHIEQIKRGSGKNTELIFKNGRNIHLDISYGSMLNQVQRTAHFRYILNNRIKYQQGSRPEWVADPFDIE